MTRAVAAARAVWGGGLVVASNHISFWDPPLVGCALPREVHFLAKEELFGTLVLGGLIRSLNAIPIRRGMADLSGLARAIAMVRKGGALLVFPEGSRMRDGELHPPRPGAAMMAVQADVPIVPCCVLGSNRPRRWLLPPRRSYIKRPLRVATSKRSLMGQPQGSWVSLRIMPA